MANEKAKPANRSSVSVRSSAPIDFRLSNIRVFSLEKRRGMPTSGPGMEGVYPGAWKESRDAFIRFRAWMREERLKVGEAGFLLRAPPMPDYSGRRPV